MNTSFLPSTSSTLDDEQLLDFIQAWLVGISGISGDLIRPRWQTEPPNLPPIGTNWIAFGIIKRTPDVFIVERPMGGYNETQRHEVLEFLCSIYGPNSGSISSLLRDGMQVSVNHEYLSQESMGLVQTTDPVNSPEFIKGKWYQRQDFNFLIKRQIKRTYQVATIQSAEISLDNEYYITNISVQEP